MLMVRRSFGRGSLSVIHQQAANELPMHHDASTAPAHRGRMTLDPLRSPSTVPGHATGPGPQLVILDSRVVFGRLVELVVLEGFPETPVRTFADPSDAERWIAMLDEPVVVLTDLDAYAELVVERAASWSSRAGAVAVVVLADEERAEACPYAFMPRPTHLAGWYACIARALSQPVAWHTASPWVLRPSSDA